MLNCVIFYTEFNKMIVMANKDISNLHSERYTLKWHSGSYNYTNFGQEFNLKLSLELYSQSDYFVKKFV